MDSQIALQLLNVNKSYSYEVFNPEKKGILSKSTTKRTNVVLNKINLTVRKGEVLGVLGRNGSGKSTLLSIIARILEPDSGSIEYSGKIASILELGMGFHSDMTGRENIYLKGELYGFSKKDLSARMDSIIKYSGIERYIDNPVRTYSSGMVSRLAFSILVNIDADIMLVDEVLSTGDSAFSSKASQHFKKLAKSGRTVIIVSHSIQFLEEVCSRCIILENGSITADGNSKTVCSKYNNSIMNSLDVIKDLAESGIPEYQYKFACLYKNGNEVKKDVQEYIKWLKSASESGYVPAEMDYADYLLASNEQSDRDQAYELYLNAAEKGNPIAKSIIASFEDSSITDSKKSLINLFEQIAQKNGVFNELRFADLLLKNAWSEDERKSAFKQYELVASHGQPQAYHQLAIMYRDGIGTKKDYNKMVEMLEKACDFEVVSSMVLYADLLMAGKIIPLDESHAFKLYLHAAQRGNSNSMYKVASMYKGGIGVEMNQTEANKWFHEYAFSSLANYQIIAADYLKSGEYDTSLSPETLSESAFGSGSIGNAYNILSAHGANSLFSEDLCNQALELLTKASVSGSADASHKLGNLYYEGIFVKRDYPQAIVYYQRAAEFGDAWCKNRLGEMFRDGKGVIRDLDKAVYWFMASARQNTISALVNLISLHASREVTDEFIFEYAFNNLKKLADFNSSDAMRRIGTYYYEGLVVPRNYSLAMDYYKKAALTGSSWCKLKVAEMYRDGLGTEVDLDEASKWFVC